MTTLVFDAIVQPPREVGHHLLTHSERYGEQFPLNCILQLRNIAWLVDVHFSFEVHPQKEIARWPVRSARGGGARHITSVGDELPRKQPS